MINLLLLLLLLFGVLMGLRRGLILQSAHLIGFIAAFVLAVLYYDNLASQLTIWIPYPDLPDESSWAVFLESSSLKNGFYNAFAFALIFFAVKFLMQILASMIDFVASLPLLNWVNHLLGAVFGFLEVYLLLFILLYTLAFVPVMTIQNWIGDSSLAMFIIEKTPFLSEQLQSLWMN